MVAREVSKQKRTFAENMDSMRQVGFDVVVEQVIASIEFSDSETRGFTAIEAAFHAIGKHVAENSEPGSPFAGGVFRFSINGEVTTIAVNVD